MNVPQPLAGLPHQKSAPQPLAGLRVVEFTHMVMGPTCGMVLADLGAEVVKVEPVGGDLPIPSVDRQLRFDSGRP